MSFIQNIIECVLESVLSCPIDSGYNSLVGLIMLVVAFVPLGTSLLAVCFRAAWHVAPGRLPSCRLARRSWPSAFVPLGTSLLAVCLSQAVLKQQRGIHANKRLDTPLDELQSRLREALLVDRAVQLRTSAISFSLS